MLFARTLGLTFAIASIFLIKPKSIKAASVPFFDNMESMDTKEELLPLTTTFKEFNWKGDSTYAGQTFIVSLDEPAQFQVTDYKNRGDHFDIYDNRLWIGRTSTVELLRNIHGFARTPRHALGNSHFSQGVFGLNNGTHIITIKATSPYGEGSGAIRLITGIDDQDNVEMDGDYFSNESNSTNTNKTTTENDQSNGERSSTQINDITTSIQDEAQYKDGYKDRNEDDIKSNDGENNEESDEDDENNDGSQLNGDNLDYDTNNSTSTDHKNEDVPVSSNLTSTSSNSSTILRSFKSYSTVTTTVVRTVFVDEPSSTSILTAQISGSAETSVSQASASQTSESSTTSGTTSEED